MVSIDMRNALLAASPWITSVYGEIYFLAK